MYSEQILVPGLRPDVKSTFRIQPTESVPQFLRCIALGSEFHPNSYAPALALNR